MKNSLIYISFEILMGKRYVLRGRMWIRQDLTASELSKSFDSKYEKQLSSHIMKYMDIHIYK